MFKPTFDAGCITIDESQYRRTGNNGRLIINENLQTRTPILRGYP